MSERVLIVVGTYPDGGGISSIVDNYVATLGGGYEVHVAIVEPRAGRERLAVPPERVHVLGYTNAINPLLFPASLLYTARVGRWLRRLVTRIDPALVITQDGLNLPVPALLAVRGRRTRAVVMDHGTLTNVHEPGWMRIVAGRLGRARGWAFRIGFVLDTPWRAARWRLGVAAADELWFTGEELEPYFGRAGGRARRYAQVVPPGFGPPAAGEREAARRALGLPLDGTVLNVVGRMDGEKGLDTILEALDADRLARAGATLVVAGDGTLREWFAAEIRRRGLDGRVRLPGRLERDEVRRLQAASDFHLYAGTISCGVSICLLEAMASGVIPIASDVPRAQRPLVGDAGWVFPAGDAAALRRALAEAVATPASERSRRRSAVLAQLRAMPGESIAALVARAAGAAGPRR